MSLVLGIGIITFNRSTLLNETIGAVIRHTRYPFTLVVADDGSTDGTREAMLSSGIPCVSGSNRGVAWNKNRALFWLAHIKKCDVIILLEDDAAPQDAGWEKPWIDGAAKYGHLNLAGDWFKNYYLDGTGTVDDPIRCAMVSGQCSCFSREAVLFGGFLDTRFKGFGFGHVEHSLRLMRLGYGGRYENNRPIYYLLKAPIVVGDTHSHSNPEAIERNRLLCNELLQDVSFRGGAQNETEMKMLREEMNLSGSFLR
jgi:glycosyltransferase involved in cell wall biosynthesis